MKKLLAVLALCVVAMPSLTTTASAHDCHRYPQEGRYGWHRHVGPDCDRVAAPRPGEYRERYYEGRRPHHHEPICEKKCKYVGPFKTCKTVCS
jgi:hypothetical protein